MVITFEKIGHSVSYTNKINSKPAFGNKTKSEDNTQITKKHKNNYLIPATTITAGIILLFSSLKNSSKAGKLRQYIIEKITLIDSKKSEFNKLVQQIIEEIFPDAAIKIKNFKNERSFSPTNPVRTIKSSESLSQLIENQDNAFRSMEEHINKFDKGGATPYDKFTNYLEQLRRKAWAQLIPTRDQLQLEFNDIANIPDFANNSHLKLTKLTREILNKKKDKTINQINSSTDKKLIDIVRLYSGAMADTIIDLRIQQKNTKEKFITTAFKQANELLGNSPETLKTTFQNTPTLENFSKLTPEQLKPTNVSEELSKVFGNNTYFEAIIEKDFNTINAEDLKQIFYHSSYDNNLNDLGILIDRLRLRQAINKTQTPDSETYKIIIPKLEYLANNLKTFGEKELLKRNSKDFNKMNSEQKKAALFYISQISRHLGYESIIKMDNELSKTNKIYKKSNLHTFIHSIKQNPEFVLSN